MLIMDHATRFQNMYKSRLHAETQPASLQQRVQNLTKQRRSSRNTAMLKKRNICQATLTPIASPSVPVKNATENHVSAKKTNNKRFEMLKQWQAEKKKRLEQEKSTAKPLFKVHHVTGNDDYKNLDKIYNVIKGKPITTSGIKSKKNQQQTNLAPSSTYKFKPPANIKPINLKLNNVNEGNRKSKMPAVKLGLVPNTRVPRSQKAITSTEAQLPTIRKKLNFQSSTPKKRASTKGTNKDNPELPSTSSITRQARSRKNSVIVLSTSSSNEHSSSASSIERPPKKEAIRKSLNQNTSKQLELEPTIKTGKNKSVTTIKSSTSSENASMDLIENPSTKTRKSRRSLSVQQNRTEVKNKNIASRNRRKSSLVSSESVQNNEVFLENNIDAQKKSSTTSGSSLSTEYPLNNSVFNKSSASSQPETPLAKRLSSDVVYVSPFVTMSRGKENARKEFHRRSVRGGSEYENSPFVKADVAKTTSPKAAVVYFYKLIDEETCRMRKLCNKWNVYKDEQQPPEEACNMINVAVGQTDLLLTKKFEQFRGLIDACESGHSEKPITCLDLHGFWDMILIQVDNINKRFENLQRLKENAWEEIVPVEKASQREKPKKKFRKKTTTSSTSSLKAIIQAARQRKAACTDNKEELSIFPSTNLLQPCTPKSPHARRSLRISTLTAVANRTKGTPVSSPGLTIMKVTQAAKSAEKSNISSTPLNEQSRNTPRSILKTRKSTSAFAKSKIVLFKENDLPNEDVNQENNVNTSNLILFSPVKTRRSKRLGKNGL